MFGRRREPAAPVRGPGRGWRSFDLVAETYDRVRTPIHEPPARDLVATVGPPPGGRVLDVGTGPGIAAAVVAEEVGPDGLVVGIDPSPAMLRLARGRGLTALAVAEGVDLPFRDGTFDAVIGSFVMAFFTKYDTALFDMIRVLRPGGRLGVTTWGPRDDEFTRAWRDVAESFAAKELLDDARRTGAPWEERFSDPGRLEEALRDAGVRPVEVHRRQYRTALSLDDYLASSESNVTGRFLRDMLGDALWQRFRDRVAEEFRRRFTETIGDTNEVLIGVGIKPR